VIRGVTAKPRHEAWARFLGQRKQKLALSKSEELGRRRQMQNLGIALTIAVAVAALMLVVVSAQLGMQGVVDQRAPVNKAFIEAMRNANKELGK
jgi:Mn2+/Fe2+ NRAMP family transporter